MPVSLPRLYAAAVAAFLKRPLYFYATLGLWLMVRAFIGLAQREAASHKQGIGLLLGLLLILLSCGVSTVWALAAISARDDAPLPFRDLYVSGLKRLRSQLVLAINIACYAIVPVVIAIFLGNWMIGWSLAATSDQRVIVSAAWIALIFFAMLIVAATAVPFSMATLAVATGERGWGAFRRWLIIAASRRTFWTYACIGLLNTGLGFAGFGWQRFADWLAASVLHADGLAIFIAPIVEAPLGAISFLVVVACWSTGDTGSPERDRSYRAPALCMAAVLAVVGYAALHPHPGPMWYGYSLPGHRRTSGYTTAAECERARLRCYEGTGLRFGW
jgi:hypothetical protein